MQPFYFTLLGQFSSVQLLSHVWLFPTPWTAARQASLSITNSERLQKLMSIGSVMPFNHLILCRPFSSSLQLSQNQFQLQFSRSLVSDSLWPHELQHAKPPVHHQHPEFTQTHVHWVGDAIQPSHPLSSPSPPALTPSQHQDLFQWVNSLHEVAKVLEFQL